MIFIKYGRGDWCLQPNVETLPQAGDHMSPVLKDAQGCQGTLETISGQRGDDQARVRLCLGRRQHRARRNDRGYKHEDYDNCPCKNKKSSGRT